MFINGHPKKGLMNKLASPFLMSQQVSHSFGARLPSVGTPLFFPLLSRFHTHLVQGSDLLETPCFSPCSASFTHLVQSFDLLAPLCFSPCSAAFTHLVQGFNLLAPPSFSPCSAGFTPIWYKASICWHHLTSILHLSAGFTPIWCRASFCASLKGTGYGSQSL